MNELMNYFDNQLVVIFQTNMPNILWLIQYYGFKSPSYVAFSLLLVAVALLIIAV